MDLGTNPYLKYTFFPREIVSTNHRKIRTISVQIRGARKHPRKTRERPFVLSWASHEPNLPANGRDPFNQNSDRSDREKWSTSKGGPVFSKLFRTEPIHWVLDRKFWLNESRPQNHQWSIWDKTFSLTTNWWERSLIYFDKVSELSWQNFILETVLVLMLTNWLSPNTQWI